MGIQAEIEAPVSRVFRRASIQRRSRATGQFDGVWRDISEHVKQWGEVESRIDDVRLNRFQHGSLHLVVNNDTGAFNHETNRNSLWYGYLSRYRTLVRVEAGYYDTGSWDELPATSTVGYFVMDDEVSIKSNSNDVDLRCASLQSIFDEVRARDINGFGAAQSVGAILAVIRDHTDGAGTPIFRSFITSTAWAIDSDSSNNYVLATLTTLENLTAWDLIEKLAEAEGKVALINRQGGFEFRSRSPRTTTSAFSFRGQDFPRPTVVAITSYKEAVNKYYNFFRLKYLQADTSTSYVTAGTTTAINSSNPSWIFGQRVYEFENLMVQNTATAQAVVDNLFTTFGTMTSEAELETLYVPGLELIDRIDVGFHSYDLAGSTIWDAFDWAPDTGNTGATWSAEGENFEWDSRQFTVIAKTVDLDSFKTVLRARDLTA